MRGRGLLAAAAMTLALVLAPSAAAQDDVFGRDDFGGFRNVLAVGQGETVNAQELAAAQAGSPPPSFTNQLSMYRDLLYAAPGLKPADLDTYFKPASFGAKSADVVSTVTPRAGVRIVRDDFNVPHVYGDTRADTMFGAGYASAEDRLFLMDVLRHTGRGRLTELIGPGDGDANVKSDAAQLLVADYSEEELQGMIDRGVADAGAEGQLLKADLDSYVEGINAYIAEARRDASKMPGEYAALGFPEGPSDWKHTDTVAVASLIGGIFGRGGGAEVDVAQVLAAARERFGRRRAPAVFRDLRQEDDPEAPVTTGRRFPFDDPGRVNRAAVAIPDLGSVKPRDPIAGGSGASGGGGQEDLLGGVLPPIPRAASNVLLVNAASSRSGRPIAVMGPQVGYYSPEILMEMDLHGPGIAARGATFPGISLYILLGRGQDYAWSATTAYTDVVDEFVERLCNPDGSKPTLESTHYVYRGRCVPLLQRDHVLRTRAQPTEPGSQPRTITLKVERSVHGPIQGRATVRGAPVAIAEARSTYMHELDSAVAFKRLTGNEVTDARSFQRTMGRINFAFNWFYADDRDIAYELSGWYPRRARGVDDSLPAWGTGEWDWQGFDPESFNSRRMPFRSLPKDINPSGGFLANWNNKQAPGWRAADDRITFSSVHRQEILADPIRRDLKRGGKVDLTRLTQIVQLGATVDVRGQEIVPLLRRALASSRDPEARALIDMLHRWSRGGAHRRDLDRDGAYDDGGAVALMDAWWDPMVRRIFEPVLGVPLLERAQAVNGFGEPPPPDGSAFGTGWWGYVDKDLRRLLKLRVGAPLSRVYCGRGSRARCAAILAGTLKDAAARVRARYGVQDVAQARVPATCREGQEPRECDQIEFVTAGGVETPPIPFQNRPTFQQLVEVQGHRPR